MLFTVLIYPESDLQLYSQSLESVQINHPLIWIHNSQIDFHTPEVLITLLGTFQSPYCYEIRFGIKVNVQFSVLCRSIENIFIVFRYIVFSQPH